MKLRLEIFKFDTLVLHPDGSRGRPSAVILQDVSTGEIYAHSSPALLVYSSVIELVEQLVHENLEIDKVYADGSKMNAVFRDVFKALHIDLVLDVKFIGQVRSTERLFHGIQRRIEAFDTECLAADVLSSLVGFTVDQFNDRLSAEEIKHHEEAWEFFKRDYVCPDLPSLGSCYDRLKNEASERGWASIPSPKSLRQRLIWDC